MIFDQFRARSLVAHFRYPRCDAGDPFEVARDWFDMTLKNARSAAHRERSRASHLAQRASNSYAPNVRDSRAQSSRGLLPAFFKLHCNHFQHAALACTF